MWNGVSRRVFFAAAVLAPACATTYGSESPTPVVAGDAGADASTLTDGAAIDDAPVDSVRVLPECRAQRVVHLVAGAGGLAWFTLVWPLPAVITGFQPTYSYDSVSKVANPITDLVHPLYVRKYITIPLWANAGARPHATAFVVGLNQTHTAAPSVTKIGSAGGNGNGIDVIAAGAVAQKTLAPPVPVLSFTFNATTLQYGPAINAPPADVVASIDGAMTALKARTPIPPALESELAPSPTKLTSWGVSQATPSSLQTLASNLLFTSNLMRHGLVGTVLLPALDDDPHGAFADVPSLTLRADTLTAILDGFYRELGGANEPACLHNGAPLSLADNVVFVVSGDTPKTSFERSGWPDGTIGSSNVLYVRSNGYMIPGWFGSLSPADGKVGFDPATGLPVAAADPVENQTAALKALLFAITRGDATATDLVAAGTYSGVVSKTLP